MPFWAAIMAVVVKNLSKMGEYASFFYTYKHTEAKKEWVERINRENFKPTENTRICEHHFAEDAYIPGSVTLVVELKGTALSF